MSKFMSLFKLALILPLAGWTGCRLPWSSQDTPPPIESTAYEPLPPSTAGAGAEGASMLSYNPPMVDAQQYAPPYQAQMAVQPPASEVQPLGPPNGMWPEPGLAPPATQEFAQSPEYEQSYADLPGESIGDLPGCCAAGDSSSCGSSASSKSS